jgi:tetratricopeptide (TPR) repeat protein
MRKQNGDGGRSHYRAVVLTMRENRNSEEKPHSLRYPPAIEDKRVIPNAVTRPLEEASGDPYLSKQHALACYDKGDFIQALEHFKKSVVDEHNYHLVGICYFNLDQFEAAKEYFDRSLLLPGIQDDKNRYAVEVLIRYCYILEQQEGCRDEFIGKYDRLSAFFNNPELGYKEIPWIQREYLLLSVVAEAAKNNAQSMTAAYHLYTEKYPEFGNEAAEEASAVMMLRAVARCFVSTQGYADAISILEMIQDSGHLNISDKELQVNCYYRQYQAQAVGQSDPQLRQNLITASGFFDSNNERFNTCLANLAMEDRRWQEMKSYCDRVAAVNPNNQQNLKYLAQYHFEFKEFDNALEMLDRLLPAEKNDPIVLSHFGAIYYWQGKIAEAVQTLDKALDKLKTCPMALAYRALIHIGKGEYEEALEKVKLAIESSGQSPDDFLYIIEADALHGLLLVEDSPQNDEGQQQKKRKRGERAVKARKKSRQFARQPKASKISQDILPGKGQVVVVPTLKMLAANACRERVAEAAAKGGSEGIFAPVIGKSRQLEAQRILEMYVEEPSVRTGVRASW